jgi:hypothetical protein
MGCGTSKQNISRVQLPVMQAEEAVFRIGKHLVRPDDTPLGQERLRIWREMLTPGQDDRVSIKSFASTDSGYFTLQGRIWEGVPGQYRWLSWLTFKKLLDIDMVAYSALPLGSPESVVYKDIGRTFPAHPYFKSSEAQAKLGRVLSKFEQAHPKVGYCQGMNYVAGLLLMASGGVEEETYAMFCCLLERNLGQMYAEGMPYLIRACHAFNLIFRQALPDLHAHLLKEGVPQELWLSKWFLTLFALSLPIPVTLRVWDLLIVQGEVALHIIAIGILEHLQPKLLQLDLSDIALAFNSLNEACPVAETLLDVAFKHNITPAQLKQCMADYSPDESQTVKPLDVVLEPTRRLSGEGLLQMAKTASNRGPGQSGGDEGYSEGLLERLESLTSSVTQLPKA